MRVYVASRTRHARMWQMLRQGGAPITSTWIDEVWEGAVTDHKMLWARIQREVLGATRLVFFAEAEDFPLKGALVEVGMALAAAIPVYVVLDPDVKVDVQTLRPVGSWVRHPGVRIVPVLADALQ